MRTAHLLGKLMLLTGMFTFLAAGTTWALDNTERPVAAMTEVHAAKQVSSAVLKKMYQEGMAHIDRGELDEARAIILKAIALKPDFAPLHHSLGIIHFKSGYLDLAIISFERAKELGIRSPTTDYLIGLTYSRLGFSDDALSAYLAAISVNPTFHQAYHNAGLVYFQKGQWENALEMFDKAIALDPANDRLMFIIGLTYIRMKSPEKALDLITQLRDLKHETKAAKLESLMRPPPQAYPVEEPPAALFQPQVPPGPPPSRNQGTISITGKAQITMQGLTPPEEE